MDVHIFSAIASTAAEDCLRKGKKHQRRNQRWLKQALLPIKSESPSSRKQKCL